MRHRYGLIALSFALSFLMISSVVFAGNEVNDVITFDREDSKEGKVTFNHKKHFDEDYNEYPELYESACGECHHDKDNKKLESLKDGDDVQKCVECHKTQGYIKGKKARSLSKKQKREYLANAFHDNCKGCHKTYNKERSLKPKDKGYAPNTCKTCHEKKK